MLFREGNQNLRNAWISSGDGGGKKAGHLVGIHRKHKGPTSRIIVQLSRVSGAEYPKTDQGVVRPQNHL